jgi:hypothetical protein
VYFVPTRRAKSADSDFSVAARCPAARTAVLLHKAEALPENPDFYFIYYILKIGLKKY